MDFGIRFYHRCEYYENQNRFMESQVQGCERQIDVVY